MQKSEKKPLLEYVDLCNGECWGKQKLIKVRGKEEYVGGCTHNCRMKEPCINASREEIEKKGDEIQNIPYNPFIGEVKKGMKDAFSDAGEKEDYIESFLRKHNVSPELAPAFRDVVYQFIVQISLAPKLTNLLVEKALSDMSQAEYARRKGVTRQAIGFGISTELAGVMKMKINTPPELSPLEKAVYELLYVDGCTIRSAAKQLGMSKSSIARLGQKISTKLKNSGTNKIRKNKKNQKNISKGRKKNG